MEIQYTPNTCFIPSRRSDVVDIDEIVHLPKSEMMDFRLLRLDVMDPLVGSREKLVRKVTEMPPDELDEMLLIMEDACEHSKVGSCDEPEWFDIHNDPDAGGSIERLLALLLAVLRLVAKVNTEQTKNAAQMGILSTKLAEQSGAFSVNSAMSSLSGASTAFCVGGIMTALGVMTSGKGINTNIGNIKKNVSEVDNLRSKSTQINNEIASLSTSYRSPEVLHTKKNDLAALQHEARNVESLISSSLTEQQILRLSADRMQMAGNAMIGLSYTTGGLGIAAFGVRAASEKADATISDAHKEVASGLQRNEDQAAQQKADIVAKILALVAAAQDANIQTVSTLSQAIRV